MGQFTIQSAWMLGVKRVIAIDNVPGRLQLAQKYAKAETINSFDAKEVYETLMVMTQAISRKNQEKLLLEYLKAL